MHEISDSQELSALERAKSQQSRFVEGYLNFKSLTEEEKLELGLSFKKDKRRSEPAAEVLEPLYAS